MIRIGFIGAIAGVVIGTASLVATCNFTAAAQREIERAISRLDSRLLFIQQTWNAAEGGAELRAPPLKAEDGARLLQALPALGTWSELTRWGLLVPHADNYLGTQGFGVSAEFARMFSLHLAQGRFFTALEEDEERRVCVLGDGLARSLGRNPAALVGTSIEIQGQPLRVLGIVDRMDNCPFVAAHDAIFLPGSTLRRLCDRPGVEMLIFSVGRRPDAALHAEVAQVLMQQRDRPNFRSWDQNAHIEEQRQIARTIDWMVNSVSLLTLLVACIGCANVMAVAVAERSTEIGLRMAVGATRMSILAQFLLEGMMLVLAGGALGVLAGYYLTEDLLRPLAILIPDYRGWDFSFSSVALLKALAVLVFSAFGASLFPALRAASLDPATVLRES